MHKFKEMVDHYKSTHRLDNETAWDIISSFDNHFEHKTQGYLNSLFSYSLCGLAY